MRKKVIAVLAAAALACTLAGCGNSSQTADKAGAGQNAAEKAQSGPAVEDAETGEKHIPTDAAETVADELTDENIDSFVEIGDYKGLDIGASEDLVIEPGMTAYISYKGTINGYAFDGGTDTSYELIVGSSSFPSKFDETLVGHKAGDAFKFSITYPPEYSDENLAGQKVVYVVKIERVLRTPPDMVCMQYMDACTVKKYPEAMIDELTDSFVKAYRVSTGGSDSTPIDELLEKTGMSRSMVTDMVMTSAKRLLVSRAVFVKEGVSREDAEYLEILQEILDVYGIKSAEEADDIGISVSDIYETADVKMLEKIILKYGK
ncbi:MAG: FKBP-type peptidyl-prolyl cis-trans isomerase [Lachnospiraceae bacterium]|nr:FKBP-type peptidyl-prolyl cis-trans isomerase [Lachnospiraceae bacterium]